MSTIYRRRPHRALGLALRLEVLPRTLLADDFGYLSREEQPKVVQSEQVAMLLVGAIGILGNTASVSAILEKARSVSPQLIRAFASDDDARAQLTGELITMMDGWPDFSYRIIKGFLTWSAFSGSTSGTLSFDCLDAKFSPWQRHILALGAKSFEQVEGVFR